jgi:hypothetical protein
MPAEDLYCFKALSALHGPGIRNKKGRREGRTEGRKNRRKGEK